jgi:curli biogenesis system outer membrane secretion channel CsgG
MLMFGTQTRLWRGAAAVALLANLSACATNLAGVQVQRVVRGEVPIQLGPPARQNVTPMEGVLACFTAKLGASGRRPLVIGVGDIKDFTGRYSINEGSVVTQGGSLMLFSALGKMGGMVRIAERFDASIAEREIGYMDRRQLGNGEMQEANGQKVPWLPYYGGTVQASDFYIAGGISEVNFNISSGGAEASINNIGAKRRTYTQSVAVDLRIVDTKTLLVVDAISLSKQFSGYEVGANTFRFFGLGLLDINIGQKGQEPLQLGIRAAIEEAAVRLVGRVTGVDPGPCLGLRTTEIQPKTSEQLFIEMAQISAGAAASTAPAPGVAPVRPPSVPATPLPAKPAVLAGPPAAPRPTPNSAPSPAAPPKPDPRGVSLNAVSDSGQAAAVRMVQIPFEVGEAKLAGPAQVILDSLAGISGQIQIVLVTRDSENLDPTQRARLTDQRISNLASALRGQGVPLSAMSIIWRPGSTDATIYREGPGAQALARLKITK